MTRAEGRGRDNEGEHYSPSFQNREKALRNVSKSAAHHVSAVLPRRGRMPLAHVN